MGRVSPKLGAVREWRELRRFVAVMLGHVITRLETARWWLQESPSRTQVEAWQRTVFEEIYMWRRNEVDPVGVVLGNAKQVGNYFPEFKDAWERYSNYPDEKNRAYLKRVSGALNRELADAYGLPAAHLYR
jgi:hypothetical protein